MLTIEELELLGEALEAWEKKDEAGNIVTEALMAGPLINSTFGRQLEKEKAKWELATKARKDRSVLLRAKLIEIRRDLERTARNSP